MYRGLRVSSVVPAFNEEALIRRALASIPAWVDHVVVVDDGSRDDTADAALRVGDPRIEVIRHTQNRGAGAAIVSGYRQALAAGSDAAVVLAGDAQMDPLEMPRLLDPIASGHADYVKGTRLGHPDLRRRMPVTRRIGNRVLSELTRLALGDGSLTDSQCGYTAISRGALEALPLHELWPRYGYPNDLLSLLLDGGLRVAERPVTPIYADEQSGISPWTVLPTFGFVLGRAWVRRRTGSV
ncbi:MAG: glycosyltransferase involved in cell wall biosynthesis [Myxococcota bacterium]|jgi:glycosyltransferase involved in cell wall biosynthesis